MTPKKRKPVQTWYYMHTIRGYPAQYYPEMQICYADGTRGNSGVVRLAESRHQVKAEQKASSEWRQKRGYQRISEDYGYIRIARTVLITPIQPKPKNKKK